MGKRYFEYVETSPPASETSMMIPGRTVFVRGFDSHTKPSLVKSLIRYVIPLLPWLQIIYWSHCRWVWIHRQAVRISGNATFFKNQKHDSPSFLLPNFCEVFACWFKLSITRFSVKLSICFCSSFEGLETWKLSTENKTAEANVIATFDSLENAQSFAYKLRKKSWNGKK